MHGTWLTFTALTTTAYVHCVRGAWHSPFTVLYDAGGVLFAVPIPSEAAADGTRIEAAIQQALQEADEQAVVSDDAFTPTLRET